MVDTIKELITHQFEAALCTLNACMERCPDTAWGQPVGNYKFGQVVFHALFFADYYLGRDAASLRRQPFHRDHAETFGDYEELADHAPRELHDRVFVKSYLDHCRRKASEAIAAETSDSLQAWCGFERKEFSRAELYVYNLRHIQHHAAQLSLRLRIDADEDVPWIGCGWRDV